MKHKSKTSKTNGVNLDSNSKSNDTLGPNQPEGLTAQNVEDFSRFIGTENFTPDDEPVTTDHKQSKKKPQAKS